MMKEKPRKSQITGFAVLMVFCLFAVCILGVLLTGANVYGKLVERSGDSHALRTAAQYIATRVHQAEQVTAEDFGGVETMVIREEINGETYLTRVYAYEGWLRELFTAEGGSFSPKDGEKVLEMSVLSIIIEADMLTAEFTLPDGTSRQVIQSLRVGEVGG